MRYRSRFRIFQATVDIANQNFPDQVPNRFWVHGKLKMQIVGGQSLLWLFQQFQNLILYNITEKRNVIHVSQKEGIVSK